MTHKNMFRESLILLMHLGNRSRKRGKMSSSDPRFHINGYEYELYFRQNRGATQIIQLNKPLKPIRLIKQSANKNQKLPAREHWYVQKAGEGVEAIGRDAILVMRRLKRARAVHKYDIPPANVTASAVLMI